MRTIYRTKAFKYCLLVTLLTTWCFASAQDTEAKEDTRKWWQFAIIPPLGGFVGWATNWLALKMTFYPIDFIGVPFILFKNQPVGFFGWQGIIPCKAGKMAGISVDLMVGKLIDVKKVFQRLDPYKMAKVLEPGMLKSMRVIVDDAASHQMPSVWENVPAYIKEDLYSKTVEMIPEFFQSMLADVQDNIFDVFDIRDFAVRKMTLDKSIANNIFLKCGAKEFRFIERSGFVFGFMFGCVQTLTWYFYDEDWVLPFAGFIVGFATNWLALKMIFEPVEPVYFWGYKIQGLFLQRQAEVAIEFAKMSADLIFTSAAMWEEILYGPLAPKFEEYVRLHVKKSMKKQTEGMEDGITAYLTDSGFLTVQDRIADNIIADIPNTIHLGYEYSQEALGIEKEIREKLSDLPSAEFEGVLHPVFQEDEFKLILVGAVLGMGVGFAQLYIFAEV